MFERGIKIFGDRGWKGGMKELTQLNDCEVFSPRLVNELTTEEKMKAQEALLLLILKRGILPSREGCVQWKANKSLV